jgi:hypothetical protein
MPPLKLPWQPEFQLFVESTSVPGVSGVAQCVLGAHLALQSEGDAHRLVATEASVLWLAFYGKQMLERNWQPFDQTSPASYMPLPLTAFDIVPLSSGALLVQRKASRLRLPHPVSNGGGGHHVVQLARSREEALRELERLLRSMVPGPEAVSLSAERVLSRLLGGDESSLNLEVSSPAAAPSS